MLKGNQQAYIRLRLRNQLHRELCEDAQRSLAPYHQVDQAVSAGGFHVLPAQRQDFPIRQHHFHAQHIVPCHTVAHRAHPARVGHGVAAHGGRLFTGVRGIEQPRPFQRLGKLHQQHARLHRGRHIARIHLQYPLHPFGGQYHAAFRGHAAPAQPRACAPRRYGNVALVAVAQHGANLLRALCLQHRFGSIVPIDGHLVMVIIGGDRLAAEYPPRQNAFKKRQIRFVHPVKRFHPRASFSRAIKSGTI